MTNDVDPFQKMLTSVLTFKLLVINDVDLVDLYTRYYISLRLRAFALKLMLGTLTHKLAVQSRINPILS
jgi:hypothetical protein